MFFLNVKMLTSEGVFAYDKNVLPPKEKECCNLTT